MRQVSEGYTIVEVIIFLAISVALMASAWKLIGGKQENTTFSQKARDTQSKLQTWIATVGTGFTGADPVTQHCVLTGGRPVVMGPPTPSPYTPSCVYLGKAIQFTDPSNGGNDSLIYAYSVFGSRLDSGGNIPKDIHSANPTPAVGQSGGVDLTEAFDLSPLYVQSVKSTSSTNPGYTTSHLIGFYGSINDDQTFSSTNGQSDVNAYQYTFGGGAYPADNAGGSGVVACLEMTACNTGSYPDSLTQLDLCLTDGSRYVQILINSSNSVGATVSLNYLSSSLNC